MLKVLIVRENYVSKIVKENNIQLKTNTNLKVVLNILVLMRDTASLKMNVENIEDLKDFRELHFAFP